MGYRLIFFSKITAEVQATLNKIYSKIWFIYVFGQSDSNLFVKKIWGTAS